MEEFNNVDKLVSQLTSEEKIRLFNGKGSWFTYDADKKLPVLTMSDGPHGLRKQEVEHYSDINKSNVATCFPTASCLAASWNKEILFQTGKAIACEAKKENVKIVLGPGTNIKRSPLCGRNFEYFSEDPYLAGTLASSYIKGMQSEGVAVSLKHFACNNQEKRRQTSNSIVDERTLNEIYLRAFEIAVRTAAPETIMCSYNRLNGEYTCRNKKLLTDILRTKWGFKGFVMSDWGACIDSAKSITAGLDLAMPDSYGYLDKALKQALADKIISESDIENANRRVLNLAVKCASKESGQFSVDYAEQHKTALKIAQECAVLLKNENNILPLKKKQIAVIGELAENMRIQGGGSSHITTAPCPDALESLKKEGFEVLYEKGYYSGFCSSKKVKLKNRPYLKPALALAKKSTELGIPLLFFCGLTDAYEGEGFDRNSLMLPQEQLYLLDKILEVTHNVILVTFSGSPILFPFKKRIKAILHMYLCGEACGEAVASILSGKVNPSGKLAETFPLSIEDTPCCNNFALDEDNIEYREGVFVGYRHYETKNIPVQFPFGFGMSYTTFKYDSLKINLPKVSFTITNTGQVAGSETAQIYVAPQTTCFTKNSYGKNKAVRPVKELRGFEKVFLNPGETKTVEVTLDDNAFSVYSTKNNCFTKIADEYEIQVAASVKDVRLSQKIKVEGENFFDAVLPVLPEFYEKHSVVPHKKGEYTISDSIADMSKASLRMKLIYKLVCKIALLSCKGKSKEDPAVKITVSAVTENPLESLISTSGNQISEKLVRRLVKWANKGAIIRK